MGKTSATGSGDIGGNNDRKNVTPAGKETPVTSRENLLDSGGNVTNTNPVVKTQTQTDSGISVGTVTRRSPWLMIFYSGGLVNTNRPLPLEPKTATETESQKENIRNSTKTNTTTKTKRADGPYLVRFGPGPESAAVLGVQAAAEQTGKFPHGVSTRIVSKISNSLLNKGRVAPLSVVLTQFPAFQTGPNPNHFTVVLPNPVTESDARRFNAIFIPK